MSVTEWILIGGATAAIVVVLGLLWKLRLQGRRELNLDRARDEFQQRREWFEARFFTLASQSGKPRGLTWLECDFQKEVAFARQRAGGRLQAFVSVLVRFEAVEGGGMEDNPNVANVRAATAVFSYAQGRWDTEGRVVFNLSPAQTIQHFQHELEAVE